MLGPFYVVIGIAFLFSWLIQWWLKSTYAKWSAVRNSRSVTGAQVARHLLDENGLGRVPIHPAKGALTDHYDPRNKSVSLSLRIYGEPSIASAAIAAHECGHALQDRDDYGPMRFRERVVPIAQLGAQYGPWGVMGGWMMQSDLLVQIGFVMYAAALGFQILSLPVEFDASARAKDQLEAIGLNSEKDRRGASKVLRAAAMTYVAGSATAMVHLLFILVIAAKSLFRKSPA
jgi:Zn-dependent membrane protease YugP